jgi:hypothetical protein
MVRMTSFNLRWLLLVLGISSVPLAKADEKPRPEWVGQGAMRLLVSVPPVELRGRERDQRPAELAIDFQAELQKRSIEGTLDVGSIQVVPYDAVSGKPKGGPPFAYGRSEFDCPFRWHDEAIPYEFPAAERAVSSTQGKIVHRPHTRGGYFFNVLGDWQRGRLVWMHLQQANEPGLYAIYFDVLPKGELPSRLPLAAWVGDGTPRCDKTATTTMGSDHCRLDVDDWNGDGLVDLIVGEQSGHVFWWPNVGTKTQPDFRFGKFIWADGAPLDAGQGATPKVVDWNGDGVKDLLVGTHWNRIVFYRNVGTDRDRRLVYEGPLTIDGQPLELPIAPLARGQAAIFKRDYYPVIDTVDWDGDGDLDLLAGGYITGLIFLFENLGAAADGTPRLQLRGPLEADEKLLNVRYWCAAPCTADLDGDGDLDLLSGRHPMYARGEQASEDVGFLVFYENVGTAQKPGLASRALPFEGIPPGTRLTSPRLADWDADGDLDLVVASSQNVYLFENIGSRTEPRWKLHRDPILPAWGQAAISADQWRDWDGDGRLDLVQNYTVRLNTTPANPFDWSRSVSVLPGEYIAHPSGIGDDWFWPYLDDFDGDGKIDVLFGDWWGHVWLHRNVSDGAQTRFDMQGQQLTLASGERIKVGPIGGDPTKDFNALQGARTVLTVGDFDRDGRRDLVMGDTFGKVRYFRNVGRQTPEAVPTFAEPIEIEDLGTRGLVAATDWDQDGWPDVIASGANGRVRALINRGSSSPQFAKGVDVTLPPIAQPRVLVADINGDGDEDLFLPGLQGSCFVERSFLEHGYAEATLTAVERQDR